MKEKEVLWYDFPFFKNSERPPLKLKKFALQGFKSFADKTSILFDGGIIAIVGPNGCGKSNIADAIRWVTGEKSAKSMRSPSMTDVIFSGTSKRRPLNFAEVTLTLGEVGDVLPTDYEEVAITRRLHRSGESEYFINKNTVRLKDIEHMLSGTGIGKNSISIFEQGKIDQVIYLSPEERRVIIEEVAGISRFNIRKKETLRNLKKTEENLLRLCDILREVERQKNTAERQAKKAQEYQELKEELDTLDKTVIVCRWRRASNKRDRSAEKEKEAHSKILEVSETLQEREVKLHETRLLLEEREELLRRKEENYFELKNKRDLEMQSNTQNIQKMKEAQKREEELRFRLKETEEKKEASGEALSLNKHRLNEEDAKLEIESVALSEEEGLLTTARESLETLRASFQESQAEGMRLVQQESEMTRALKEAELRHDHAEVSKKATEKRVAETREELERTTEALQGKEEELKVASEEVTASKEKMENASEALSSIQDILKELNQAQSTLSKSLTEKEARLSVLKRLKEELQGFSKGTKRLIKESKDPKSPLFGKLQGLFELLDFDRSLELGLTAYLRAYSQTLVVQTNRDLELVLDFIKQENIRDVSLFSMEAYEELESTSDYERLTKEDSTPLTKQFLSHIAVLPSLSVEAVKLPKQVVAVFRDGAFVDQARVTFIPSKEENNTFAREAEMKELKEQVSKDTTELKRIANLVVDEEKERSKVQEERNQIEQTLRKKEMALVEINFALQRLSSDQQRFSELALQMEKDLQTFNKHMKEQKSIQEELKVDFERVHAENTQIQNRFSSMEENLKEEEESFKAKQDALKAKQTSYQEKLDLTKNLKYQVELFTARVEDANKALETTREEIDQVHALLETLRSESTHSESGIQESEEAVERALKAVNNEKETLQEVKKKIEELEKFVTTLREDEKEWTNKKSQAEIQIAELRTTIENLAHELDERYQLAVDEMEVEELENLRESEAHVKSLRRKIENIGPVNMTALEEKEEFEERYNTLSLQVEDLEKSKEELLEIISELETESRKLFEETFAQVQTNFRKNFEILFRGGEADLQLVGSEDSLEAGIDVIAKPPGKQMRSITLLSGGEKCMTALALLFAIFEVRPAPFCVLDEIDAPLDDSNVERFVEVLKQFTGQCQFVIITHNKRTMAIADTLYGVSMPERGVSKMLSIEFDSEKKSEPALVGS